MAMLLIFISSISNDVEHLMCLLTTCISFLVKCLLKSFVHFLTWYFVLLMGYKSCSSYILNTSLFQLYDLQIFSSSLWTVFSHS